MIVFEGLLERLESLRSDMQANVEEVSKDTIIQDAVEQYNINQLADGKKSNGNSITPDYSQTTIEIKQQKGQPTDRVTLKDTGDFYKGMTTVYSSVGITLTSSDSKTGKLTKKYGNEIFGLTPDNLSKTRELFFEILLNTIKTKYF